KTPLHDASTIKRSGHGYFAIETLPRPTAPMTASILRQHALPLLRHSPASPVMHCWTSRWIRFQPQLHSASFNGFLVVFDT
ncbi:MAG TPA: hypothetical protein VLJ78_07450, partial [Microvirga sp.]|nr:hypothetical protein [Microvirga sp.]